MLLVLVAALFNYWQTSKVQFEMDRVWLLDDGRTMVVEIDSYKGSFWNFTKREIEKERDFIGSSVLRIFERSDSGWQFKQEITAEDLGRPGDPWQPHWFFVSLLEDDFGLVNAFGEAADRRYLMLEKGDAGWQTSQAASEILSLLGSYFPAAEYYSSQSGNLVIVSRGATEDVSDPVTIFILGRGPSGWQLEEKVASSEVFEDLPGLAYDDESMILDVLAEDSLLLRTDTGAMYLFGRQGDAWSLEREISTETAPDGIDFASEPHRISQLYDGDVLLLAIEKDYPEETNVYGQESLYLLGRQDGSWRLEREISTETAPDGIDFTETDRVLSYQLKGGVLYLEIIGSDDGRRRSYILERDGPNWLMAEDISAVWPAEPGGRRARLVNGRYLLLEYPDGLTIFRRDQAGWHLDQEISAKQPLAGVDIDYLAQVYLPGSPLFIFGRSSVFAMDEDTLAIGDNRLLYVLRRSQVGWQLDYKLEIGDLKDL